MKKYVVSNEESGQTLEKYIKKCLAQAPLSFIYKLFRKKDVKVNGHWKDNKYVICENDEISVYVTDEQYEEFSKRNENRITENISSWIIYEDENVILINKPRGVLVQKDQSNDIALDEMVISYLMKNSKYDPNKDIGFKPAPIHRLDRNTAGIIIFGKNLKTIQMLGSCMQDKEKIKKKYLALVKGSLNSSGSIDIPLKKLNNGRVIEDKVDGKEAHTLYKVMDSYGKFSLVEVTLLTGRTHQIRVHLSLIGHPVVGDAKYGDYTLNKEIEKCYGFKNQFLISQYLKFDKLDGHLAYLNGKEFKIELDKEFMDLLLKVNNN